ncbi:hypothetical protein P421_16745 [Heyndrickxia coagulans P38]|uniref:ATP-binding cassette domain-containing protein n=1 Tax=Heyndrickxia coagulans TaxID=1398 RepID=UPI0005547C1C|nr:ATP-binding cassette domain-containing protein [Heyndrickxia coagulans]KGT37199.1 hypothetical protein P421_16745 [Heyndrickxia coagulans P38]
MVICEMQNIYKSFGDKIVFENFNILINQGDFLCIAGNSGTGKSTLLNMMGLLERPDSGTINVFGKQNVKPESVTKFSLNVNPFA